MALYALVQNGEFIETREMEPENVPQHKIDTDGGLMLRPYSEDEPPSFEPTLEDRVTEFVVTTETVTKTYTVTRKSIDYQKLAVKNEARRRILAVYPDWMQSNMTARAVELQDLHRQNNAWTSEEQDEQSALLAAWAWIKGVRLLSNAIENMNPIPVDYTDDSYWTAG